MTETIQPKSDKALARRRQVEKLVQLSRSTIYANVKAGTFPAPVRIGARAVAWRLADVEDWLDARPFTNATGVGGKQ
jgi:prophage regulatory protein